MIKQYIQVLDISQRSVQSIIQTWKDYGAHSQEESRGISGGAAGSRSSGGTITEREETPRPKAALLRSHQNWTRTSKYKTLHVTLNTPSPLWNMVVVASCCGDTLVYLMIVILYVFLQGVQSTGFDKIMDIYNLKTSAGQKGKWKYKICSADFNICCFLSFVWRPFYKIKVSAEGDGSAFNKPVKWIHETSPQKTSFLFLWSQTKENVLSSSREENQRNKRVEVITAPSCLNCRGGQRAKDCRASSMLPAETLTANKTSPDSLKQTFSSV